jgi:Cysteine rich repeat
MIVLLQGDARVIRCLEKSRQALQDDCKVALFDHMTLMSEDIDFNKPLKDACSAEIKENCAKVNPGHSRVIRCLQDGERDTYSDKCKAVRGRNSIVHTLAIRIRSVLDGGCIMLLQERS